jgi:TatD DNase family protein
MNYLASHQPLATSHFFPMIDTHAHLDDPEFDADRDAVIGRCGLAGVETILSVGTTVASSLSAVHLAQTCPGVYAAVGIHPNSSAEAGPDDWSQIAAMLNQPRVVALGETGLDRYRDYAPIDLQRDYFLRHVRLSQDRDLPLVIHCRDAWEDLLPLLREAAARGPLSGVLHAFSGSAATAAACVDLGLYVSFAGNVTYKNKKFQTLQAAAAAVPADRILLETDSPYLVPEPFRGRQQRNEPALVVHTAAAVAALRGVSPETLSAQTTANARRLFGVV